MQTDAKDRVEMVYAGFFVRLVAFLIDMLIVNTGLLVIRVPMWLLSLQSKDNILVRDFLFQYSIADIIYYLLTVAYFVLLTYYTGSTLGKKLFHLKVVSVEDRKMTLFEVIYRESIGRFLSAVILNLGYLMILAQKDHRGIHDLLSDTGVIYYHEKKIYVHQPLVYRNMAPQPPYQMAPNQGRPMPADGVSNSGGQMPADSVSNSGGQMPADSVPNSGGQMPADGVPNSGGQMPADGVSNSGEQMPIDGAAYSGEQMSTEQDVK